MTDVMRDELLAGLLFLVAGAFLVSSVGIWLRHAIPRSPRLFQVGSLVPGFGVASAAFMLGLNLLSDGDDIIAWAIAFFAFLAAREWVLNGYAWHHSRRSVTESHSHAEDISRRMGAAETADEDAFSEQEQEKADVRRRLDRAAAASRRELYDVEDRIDHKLDALLAAVRDLRGDPPQGRRE